MKVSELKEELKQRHEKVSEIIESTFIGLLSKKLINGKESDFFIVYHPHVKTTGHGLS